MHKSHIFGEKSCRPFDFLEPLYYFEFRESLETLDEFPNVMNGST